jgi:acyl-CoA synthetase (AMP-forming)/AMP-acid ligase II
MTDGDPTLYPGHWARIRPDHPAVVMAGSGETVTYGELDATANRLARLFRSLGLEPGDRVAVCMENRPEYLPITWGAHYAGLYYTAISSRLTSEELAYIVEDSGARVLISSPYKADQWAEIGDQLDRLDVRLAVGGAIDGFEPFEDAIAAYGPEPLDDGLEGLPMLYSSGTTGRPKGVKPPLTGEPLGAGEGLVSLLTFLLGFEDTSVYLSPAPLYHSAPLRYSMCVQRLGGTVVCMEHFDPAEALAAIERHGVTHSQWVPTMFVRMLKLPDDERTGHDLSSLRAAVHAAAPCPVAVKERMIEWWGPVLHEYYAGTEGNGFVYCDSEQWLAHRGSVGQAILGEVHIVDEASGTDVPTGEEGTVYFAPGPDGPDGRPFEYHNDPDKTEDSYLANGWSTLGDVGRLDEDGFLYLTDRKANMIISGGVNIYPQETENVLTMHPAVADVAVLGVPNDDFGEEVKAVVQPVAGAVPGDELARELIAYCREHLADVKCPRSVDFRDELPRHPTGKLYKRLLKDEYWAGHDTRIV